MAWWSPLSTVTRAVARPGRGFAAERDEAFMDLVWHPVFVFT